MYKRTIQMINGEFAIENGDLVLIDGQKSLAQKAKYILMINKNEWFLDIDLGLEYSEIQGKGITDRQIEVAIKDCLEREDDIKLVYINDITRNNKDRTVSIDITIIDNNDVKNAVEGVLTDVWT